MEDTSIPREFKEWRSGLWDKKDDAANTFGYHLIKYCRDQAVNSLSNDMTAKDRANAEEAIHFALHNVMDLVEGYWKLESGKEHYVEYILQVLVRDKEHNEVERVDISPGLDLPIGFWKWAQDGEFR